MKKKVSKVVIKFAGDSGDGMQLSGTQFSNTTAFMGNDLSTFPDFPAEIRAPQGTLFGVSGFKIHFGDTEITSPGDMLDVLVAMNPAALQMNLDSVKPNGIIIVNENSFTDKNLKKANFENNPLLEGKLTHDYKVIRSPITELINTAVSNKGLSISDKSKLKNMFALGVIYWLFNRSLEVTINFLYKKFIKNRLIAEANEIVLKAGYNFADTLELFNESYQVDKANLSKGKYKSVTGNQALTLGFIAAKEKSNLNIFFASYPITPASDILHEFSKYKAQDVLVFQAEDEIASITSAIGASFAGSLSITSTSGPGMALKTEAIGLALISELPLVIVNVQRGGPSTGLPTKTEQSDLFQALFGRNGESPVVVMSASSPDNCFFQAFMASKIALEHMTPVILLSDGYIANGSIPWKITYTESLPKIIPNFSNKENDYKPYQRNKNLVRYWAIPGDENKEHRLGGLEKEDISGNVSYNPLNHQKMVDIRRKKILKIANFIPPLKVHGDLNSKLLVVGWGGVYGDLYNAVKNAINQSCSIALAHFSYIYPLPLNTYEVLKQFDKILVCELNSGQFFNYLKMNFPRLNYFNFNKVQGLPFSEKELLDVFKIHLKD